MLKCFSRYLPQQWLRFFRLAKYLRRKINPNFRKFSPETFRLISWVLGLTLGEEQQAGCLQEPLTPSVNMRTRWSNLGLCQLTSDYKMHLHERAKWALEVGSHLHGGDTNGRDCEGDIAFCVRTEALTNNWINNHYWFIVLTPWLLACAAKIHLRPVRLQPSQLK